MKGICSYHRYQRAYALVFISVEGRIGIWLQSCKHKRSPVPKQYGRGLTARGQIGCWDFIVSDNRNVWAISLMVANGAANFSSGSSFNFTVPKPLPLANNGGPTLD